MTDFYQQKEWYARIDQTIAAGDSLKINKYARYLTLADNDSSSEPRLSINGQNGGKLITGFGVELPQGERVLNIELFNESSDPMTVSVILSNGQIFDNRSNIVGTVQVDNPSGESLAVNAGDTLTQVTESLVNGAAGREILAANANRTKALILNTHPTAQVFIGNGTGQLMPLPPSEWYETNSRHAIYAINNSGVNVDLVVEEETT